MGIYVYDLPGCAPDEARRERAVLRSGVLDLIGDPALERIVDETGRAMRTSMAAISIVSGDWQYLIAARGIAPGPMRRSHAFCAHAILHPHSLFLVPDAARDIRFADNPMVTCCPGIRFYAGQPVLSEQGEALGTLCVFDPAPRDGISPGEWDYLQAQAARVSTMIASFASPAPVAVAS